MLSRRTIPAWTFVALLGACGSTHHPPAAGDIGDTPDSGSDGGIGDDAGSGLFGGTGGGPPSGCGTVDRPQGKPLALPDTNVSDGTQPSCKVNADCSASTPNCVLTADFADGGPGYCSASYVDSLTFVGFKPGAKLTDVSKLISVCAKLEHTYLGDLQIELIAPDGRSVVLRQFVGRSNGSFFLGHANACDDDNAPVAGVGYEYCWTAAAATKLLTADSMTCSAPGGCESWDGTPLNSCVVGDTKFDVVPARSYLPDVPFSTLAGAELNGTWTFRITDLWQIDNGFLFDWSIQFDPSLVADCSNPIVK